MAQQTAIQELAQSLVPSSVNNGNPNTIYNAPQMNAQGQTFAANVNPAANLGGAALPMGNWIAPAIANEPNFRLTPLAVNPPNTNIPWITVPPPANMVPPTGPSMSNPLPPQEAPIVWPDTTVVPPAPQNPYNGQGGWAANDGIGGTAFHFNPGNPGTGSSSNGTSSPIDWRQMLDVVSEPFLPGNVWLSGSGQWDVSNALAGLATRYGIPVNQVLSLMNQTPTQAGLSLLSNATGLPLSQLSGLLNVGQGGESIANQILAMGDNVPKGLGWLQNHFLDNIQNRLDVFQRDSLSSTDANAAATRDADIIAETLSQAGIAVPGAAPAPHQFGGGYGGSAVGGFAFNSNPFAGAVTGDAAREMMAGMASRGGGLAGTGVPWIDNYIDLM